MVVQFIPKMLYSIAELNIQKESRKGIPNITNTRI
jgi:hypothetical protein